MPLISIILPTHNGARLIRRAIESARAQTFTDWELIIINDGSTDSTGALINEIAAHEPRIRILRFEKNLGVQKALNEGLMQARGQWIARIDDDDVWCDVRKLEKQLLFINENPSCVLVGTGVIVQDERGDELYRFLNPVTDTAIRNKILYRNCFSQSSVIFKKSAAMHWNGYAEGESTRHVEDYDLWLKLGHLGTMANLPEYAIRYTNRPGSVSSQNKLVQLRKQLSITVAHRNNYPHFWWSRIKGVVRYYAYKTLGSLFHSWIHNSFVPRYKSR